MPLWAARSSTTSPFAVFPGPRVEDDVGAKCALARRLGVDHLASASISSRFEDVIVQKSPAWLQKKSTSSPRSCYSAMLYALSDAGLLMSTDAGRSWRDPRGDPFWKALTTTP